MNTPVYDVCGRQLRLTTTRLLEVEGSAEPTQPWYARYSDINRAVRMGLDFIPIRMHENAGLTPGQSGAPNAVEWLVEVKTNGLSLMFGYDVDFIDGVYRRIGCRRFSEETFKYILKVAKEQMRNRKARAAKAKKR